MSICSQRPHPQPMCKPCECGLQVMRELVDSDPLDRAIAADPREDRR